MKSESKVEVTVFIATTAEKKRASSLRHAIKSVLSQVSTKLIVIINGNKFDGSLKFELENQPDIECHYLSLGNFPEALKYARKIVDTNYFSFLDDDDELTNNSIQERLSVITGSKYIDVVIGNGYRKNKENVKTHMLDTNKINMFQQDPLYSLFQRRGNWLGSCSGLYRTSSIPQEYFDDYAKYAEWSYLAVKIASYKKVKLVDIPCFIINETTGSLSHSLEYYIEQYNYLFKLLDMHLPKKIESIIKDKKIDMEHQLSILYLDRGKAIKAWYYHILSLLSFRGLKRYVLSTRHLMFK